MLTGRRTCAVGIVVTAALTAFLPAATRASSERPSVRCSFAAIDKVVVKLATSSGSKVWLAKRDVKCSGGWAVAFPDVGATRAESNTVTIVLKWNGKAWQVKSRGGKTCKSPGHEVPAPIFRLACQSN